MKLQVLDDFKRFYKKPCFVTGGLDGTRTRDLLRDRQAF